jgi:hypothetical protein
VQFETPMTTPSFLGTVPCPGEQIAVPRVEPCWLLTAHSPSMHARDADVRRARP